MKQEDLDVSNVVSELRYIRRDIEALVSNMKELNEKVEQTLVPREIFDLRVGRLENIVYGMIAIILTEVLIAAMILLLR